MRHILFLAGSCAMVSPVLAAPLVDGTRDGQYGAPLSVQTVQTQFGDSTGGVGGGGGEDDAGYAVIEGGRLYVMITGNVENNFNKLHVFIDSEPVAVGEAVKVGDKFGLRIRRMVLPRERFASVRATG